MHGHAAAVRDTQVGKVERAELRVVRQCAVQRIDARNHVERIFGKLAHEARNVARIGDQHVQRAELYAGQAIHHQREHVVERQCADINELLRHGPATCVAQRGRNPGFELQDVGDQIAVQQCRPFRDAGGPAGVLQEGDVVGTDVGSHEGATPALGHSIVETHGARE